MKKTLIFTIIALLLAATIAQPVEARSSVIKGEVAEIDPEGNTITVTAKHNKTETIILPEDFDLSTLAVGDEIIAKCQVESDGSLVADWVRLSGQDSEDEDAPEGEKVNNKAFCNNGKKQEPHPVAAMIADEYGVSADWVMRYYCEGYSMGAIMLALKTSEISGGNAEEMLAQRSDRQSWGHIWQEQKLIGNEKNIEPPPGLLHRPDNNE